MKPYLICFELNDFAKHYHPLIKALQGYPAWAYISRTSWMVSTTQSAAQIRTALKTYIGDNDVLFVIEVQPYSWAATNLNKDALEWLKS